MEPTVTPSSLLWQGGAAHLHLGGGGFHRTAPHAHFALQISVSLAARQPGPAAATVWIIGSDQPHGNATDEHGAIILLDPISAAGRSLAARLPPEKLLAVPPPAAETIRAEIEACLEQGWQLDEVRAAIDRIVNLLAPEGPPPDRLDRRVRAVLAELQSDSTGNRSLADQAAAVGLSESRLAHLFLQDVGLPMRQYRLSLRMEHALTLVAQGLSLTEAAHAAGFADSAHFARISRRMFGTAPSGLPRFTAETKRP